MSTGKGTMNIKTLLLKFIVTGVVSCYVYEDAYSYQIQCATVDVYCYKVNGELTDCEVEFK